ncbi:hypothetical protein NEOLEDRAFT_1218332, partial [Neolentinus lepideus HHB14362 ss-1]
MKNKRSPSATQTPTPLRPSRRFRGEDRSFGPFRTTTANPLDAFLNDSSTDWIAAIVEPADTPDGFHFSAVTTIHTTSDDSPSHSLLGSLYLSACDNSKTKNIFSTPGLVATSLWVPVTSEKLENRQKQYSDIPLDAFVQTKKKYKPVALKVRPVGATLPKEFRIERNITGDPLADLPTLSPRPPRFSPTGRYTQERRDALHKVHGSDFLNAEE